MQMYLWDRKIHNLHSAYKYLHVHDSIPQIIDPSYTLSIFLDCKPRGINCQQETPGGDVFTSDFELHSRRAKSWIWIDALANLRMPQNMSRLPQANNAILMIHNDLRCTKPNTTLQGELVVAFWANKWKSVTSKRLDQLESTRSFKVPRNSVWGISPRAFGLGRCDTRPRLHGLCLTLVGEEACDAAEDGKPDAHSQQVQ